MASSLHPAGGDQQLPAGVTEDRIRDITAMVLARLTKPS
jgi:hypothetical protein